MTTHAETYQLDTDLTLRDSSQSPLSVHAVTLTLTKQDDTLIESRLTFQVTPELYQRIDTVSAGTKVMEFPFEGFLNRAGGAGAKVMGILRKAGGAFTSILKNPVAFCGNLVGAVRGGCQKFSGNVATHLKNGLTGWLFGDLGGAGLTVPAQFDTKGIVSLVLQVLGATYSRLRAKLTTKIGKQKVARLEKTFDFLRTMVTGGLAAAWQKISEFAGNLQEIVMGGIKEWVMHSVITAAITKLISMFNPAGAIVQAVMAIYNTVMFFIERGSQIAALAQAVFNSIGNIAAGNVAGAANYVEQTMGRSLPVIISFLARIVGLGNVGQKVREIIGRLQARVDVAVNKLVDLVAKQGNDWLAKADRGGSGRTRDRASSTNQQTKSNPVPNNRRTPTNRPNPQQTKPKPVPTNQSGNQQDKQRQRTQVPNFTTQEEFSMSGERHHLIAKYRQGNLNLFIASDPKQLIPALNRAIAEVSKSNRTDKNYYIGILKKVLAHANDALYIVRSKGDYLKGVANDPESEREALERAIDRELALAANQLELLAKAAGIKSLDDFYALPPSQRFIPGANQTEIGKFIRKKLYDEMHNWQSTRNSIIANKKPGVVAKVLSAQQKQDTNMWQQLERDGLVEPRADIKTYNPHNVEYHVDHIEPVSARWNAEGHDSSDSIRARELLETNNLRVVTGAYNTAKGSEVPGSGRATYKPYVGLNFTSSLADGGIKGALRIDGKPFVDASGEPLI